MSKIRRTGLFLALAYAALSALMVWTALDDDDPKGRVLLLQLPVAPISAIYDAIGLRGAFVGWHWIGVYLTHLPPLLAILYWVGASLSWVVADVRGDDSPAGPRGTTANRLR